MMTNISYMVAKAQEMHNPLNDAICSNNDS